METRITEVEVIPIKPKAGLIALASLVLNDCLYLGSIGVFSKLDGSGYRLTFPTRTVNGKSMNVYHPITRAAGAAIHDAVIGKLEEVLIGKGNDRHSGSDAA